MNLFTTLWLADAAIKGAAVLSAAGLLAVLLRRASAAMRHLVWALALGSVLVLPALSAVLPRWRLPILALSPDALLRDDAPATVQAAAPPAGNLNGLPGGSSSDGGTGRRVPAAPRFGADMGDGVLAEPGASPPVARVVRVVQQGGSEMRVAPGEAALSWQALALAIWAAGGLFVLLPYLAGLLAVRRLERRSRPLDGSTALAAIGRELTGLLGIARGVRLRLAGAAPPMTFGVFRPVVLLPEEATAWPENKQRALLLHELAHVKRHDFVTHAAGRLALALHWFNPLAWLAAARLRAEREHACDDLVLITGSRPRDYAGHLLDAVRALRGPTVHAAAAVTMARGSRLEQRLAAILDANRRRGAVTLRGLAVGCVLAGLLLVPLAAARCALAEEAGDPPARADLTVAADGSAQFRSIREAIAAAPAGAVVRVAPGTYGERVVIDKPLTLEGAGWDRTVLSWPSTGQADWIAQQKRIIEAQSEAEKRRLAEEFEANRPGGWTLVVRNTAGVEISGFKITAPEEPVRRFGTDAIVEFAAAGARMVACAVVGCPGKGILIHGGSEVEIRDSLIAAVWGEGIFVGARRDDQPATPSRARIAGCDLRHCYRVGIRIRPGNDDTLVEGCRISGSAWHGIRYDDASPSISGNLLFENERTGIYASGATAAAVRGNLFLANDLAGIACWEQNRDVIEENTFASNQRSGLEVLGEANPAVHGNIFFGNPKAVSVNNVTDLSPWAYAQSRIVFSQNIFWQNQNDADWLRPAGEGMPAERGTIPAVAESGNEQIDPLFADPVAQDFSLQSGSPALAAGIGAAAPPAFTSPWPAQPEESAFVADAASRQAREAAAWRRQDAFALARPWIDGVKQSSDRARRDAALAAIRLALSSDDALTTYAGLVAFHSTETVDFDKQPFRELILPLVHAAPGAAQVEAFHGLNVTGRQPGDLDLLLAAVRSNPSLELLESASHLISVFTGGKFEGEVFTGGRIEGEAAALLHELLATEDPDVLLHQMRGFWRAWVTPEIAARLVDIARTSNREVRHDAIHFALSGLRSKSKPVIDELLRAVEEHDPSMWDRALWGLGNGVPAEHQAMVADFLLTLFEAQNSPKTRHEFLRIVGQYGDASHLDALAKIATNAGAALRQDAQDAIDQIQKRAGG